jgi:hypothetical protein
MAPFDPHKYGPIFADLLQMNRERALDAGSPECKYHGALNALSVETAFAHAKVVDPEMARCCVSGAWLICDYLDESHTISQGIDSPSGSFWHAIMHRREGDFSNAKYWLRRVGSHVVYDRLSKATGQKSWDAFAFVDQCEQAVRSGAGDVERLRKLQQQEWEELFDYCYDGAIGG